MRPQGSEYRRLVGALRSVLRERRITYKDLARELALSEVSIKRLFTRDDGPVGRLEQICEILGFSFCDLVTRAHGMGESINYLTPDQEQFFSTHLSHFDFFSELAVRRRTVEVIQRLHGLSGRSVRRYLSDLERIGVLECHTNDRVRLLVREPVGFSDEGALRHELRLRILRRLTEEVDARAELPHPMFLTREWLATPKTLRDFSAQASELCTRVDHFSAYEGRVFQRSELKPVTLLVVLAEHEPERYCIPELV